MVKIMESRGKSSKILIGLGFGIMAVPYSAKYWQGKTGKITLPMYLQEKL